MLNWGIINSALLLGDILLIIFIGLTIWQGDEDE